MGFYHKFRIKADKYFCMVHGFPSGIINCIHQNLIQFCGIHTRFAGNSSCRRITTCNGTVIEQQYFSVRLQTKFLSSVYRHVCYNSSRRILSKLISFLQGVHLHYIVAIECSFNYRAGLCKTNFVRPNLCSWIICLCCHCLSSSLKF